MFGQPFDPPTDRDRFIYGVAEQFKSPTLCEKIAHYAGDSEAGWGQPGYQIGYLQSQRYFNLAGELYDPSLCNKVSALRCAGSHGARPGATESADYSRCRVPAARETKKAAEKACA
jgi:hypothetical protein